MKMASLIMLFFLVASSSSFKIVMTQSMPSCAQSLVPCGAFLMNNTSPSASCCEVLKENISCLCNESSFFSSLNINKTEALTLPARCKISGASCSNGTDSASQPPPATPKKNGHSLGGVSWTATCTMLLFCVSLMF